MNVLVLEDNEERVKQFKLRFPTANTVYTDVADEAIKQLENYEWDVLFLDHDLGGLVHVSSSDDNTGAGVARWLDKHTDRIPNLVIIHSLNPPGQSYIKSLLPGALILPFAWNSLTEDQLSEERNIVDLKNLARTQCRR